jgi:hypothetical protein
MTRTISAVAAALLCATALSAAPQEQEGKRKVPSDSVEIFARGCLKGRVFTATARPEDEGTRRGPDVEGRHFRLSGKKDVMADVKKYDGQLVEVEGLVLKSSLGDQGIGMKVGGARVVIGAQGMDPARMNSRTQPGGGLPTMDLSAVRFLGERCPLVP